MFKFNIITLFPNFFTSPLEESLLGKAVKKGLIQTNIIDLRKYTVNNYKQVDDYPYGGGDGMVLMYKPISDCLADIRSNQNTYVVLLSPRGYILKQEKVHNLLDNISKDYDSLTIICGHYEGIDERVAEHLVDESICIGSYILSGGEAGALILIDSISRLIPNFMSNPNSIKNESFEQKNYIEYPQYTRPVEVDGYKVPKILLSGNHKAILEWRNQQSKESYSKFMQKE